MSAPELHLVLGLEAAPRLVWIADRDTDLERLLDWLLADSKLSRLLALARALENERRAA